MILDRVIEPDKNVNPVNRKKPRILEDMYHLTMGLTKNGYAKNVMRGEITGS
jgi:hypothetical protein